MKEKLLILLFIFVLVIIGSSICSGKTDFFSENNDNGMNPPYEATDPFPPDNATGVPPSPTLSVEIPNPPDPDGDAVTVYFFEVPDWETEIGMTPGVVNGGTISTTWNDATKPGSVHYWEVWLVDTFLLPSRSYTWRFKIDLPPDSPVNPSPADNERYVNVSPLLSVDVSDPDDDNMSVTFFDASDDSEIGFVDNVESGGTASITWDGIDYGTTYSWYAVADDGIFDNQSDVFSFTTNYLPVFSGLFPEDGSDDVSFYLDELSVNISDPDGDSFSWSITTFPNLGKNDGVNELNGTKTCNIIGIEPLMKCTWHIEATDMRGATKKAIYNFTTKQNIAPVVNAISPRNNNYNISIANCVLNWSCDDPDGENNKLVYDVYFGKSSNPDRITKEITDTYYSIPYDLEIDTTYYWKIIATDRFGGASKGDIWSFSTSTIPPPPAVGSIEINFPKRLYWAGVKADITNNGVRAASNVNWHVYVTGGIFNRINITKTDCIDILSLNETKRISTYEFLNFKTIPFGLGRAEVTVIATDKNDFPVGMNSVDVFIFSRLMIVINGGSK